MASNAKYAEIGQLLNSRRVWSPDRPKLTPRPAAPFGINPLEKDSQAKNIWPLNAELVRGTTVPIITSLDAVRRSCAAHDAAACAEVAGRQGKPAKTGFGDPFFSLAGEFYRTGGRRKVERIQIEL